MKREITFWQKKGLKRAQILFLMPKSNPAWSICSQLGGYLKDLSKIEGPYGKNEILEWKSEHRQIAARARARHCPKRAHTAKMRAHGLKFDPCQQILANFCFLKEFFEKMTKKISKSKK